MDPISRLACRTLVIVGIVLGSLVACGKSASKPADCRAEAEALSKLLASTPHEMSPFVPQAGITLVHRTDLGAASLPLAPVVLINATEIIAQGRLLDTETLHETLGAMHAASRANATVIYLQIDKTTPWSEVVAVVDAANQAGFTAPAFAFETPNKLTPPPRAPIDDKLDAIQNSEEAGNKATELAKLLQGIVKPCPALQEAFGAVASTEGGSKADALIAGIAPALVECKCSVDIPNLRSALWRLLAVAPVIQVIAFDATTRSETLSLPGTTTWAEASKRLSPTTKGMKLVAAE